jgi:predicted ester cyclase
MTIMSTQTNKQIVASIFSEGINKNNSAVINALIHPEYENHGMPGTAPGVEGFRQVVSTFLNAFPDMSVTVQDVVAEGDMVATRGYFDGTHAGELMGIPATGRKVRGNYMDFWKIKDGQAIENWVQMDFAGIMQQIGAMAEPA